MLGAASQLLCLLLLGLQLAVGGPLHCTGNTYPGVNRCCQECQPGEHWGMWAWPGGPRGAGADWSWHPRFWHGEAL